jgi:hypothetical protein
MSLSPTALFWIGAVIAVFPLTAIFVPIINLVGGIVAAVAAIGILFTKSVIPSSYVWGALAIFFVSCLPPVRSLGRSIAIALLGPDPGGRDVNMGDALIGALIGLWYNSGWLQFAASNNGSWLIYLNWFLASIGLWSFFGLFVIRVMMRMTR